MNPRQMKQAMRRLGIEQQDLDALEVVIRLKDKELYFENPQVAKVNMMGQDTWQVIGNPVEREIDTSVEISDEDIHTVAEQAGVTQDEARQAIKDANGDLAAAIMKLSE